MGGVMSDRNQATDRIVKVLDHPVRRRIIELLGARGPLQWKDLAKELGVATGALYYHLDTLEGLVSRDATKKYALTKPGQEIFAYIQQNPLITSVQTASFSFGSRNRYSRYLVELFVPRTLLDAATGTTRSSVATLVLISAIIVSVLTYFGNEVRLFYPVRTSDPLQIAGSYAASLFAVFAMSYLATLIIFRVRANPKSLGASAAVSFLPVLLLPLLIARASPLSALLADRNVLTIFLILFQVWDATVLGAGVSVSSGLRLEKSILVSLVVLYATMILVFLQSGTI